MSGSQSDAAVTALRAFSRGDLGAWWGLPSDCTRADAEAALGPSEPPEDIGGVLAGGPCVYRAYAPGAGTPLGVAVWFAGDAAVVIETRSPRLAVGLGKALGAPEAVEPSKLGSSRVQWVYAARGLTAHVTSGTGEIFWLYGYTPCAVEDFLAAPLARVELRRIPRR